MWYSIHVWWEFSLMYNVVWKRNRSSYPIRYSSVSFWKKLHAWRLQLYQKRSYGQVLSCEFCEHLFCRTPPVAASEESVILTHFISLVSFYTSWKHQKTFLMFLGSQNESSSTTWVNQRNMKNVARNTEKYWNTFLSRITL